MNIKRGIWLCAVLATVLFVGCKDACEDLNCNANQIATENALTGICECQCKEEFVDDDCTLTQGGFDIELIKSYLLENNIDAQSTDSGLHYVITDTQGGTTNPELTDVVDITYEGYLLDGTVFDGGTISHLAVNQFIPGWQEGLPLFSKGDKGMLFIPSGLAYNVNPPFGSGIPVNAVLIFDIELHDF